MLYRSNPIHTFYFFLLFLLPRYIQILKCQLVNYFNPMGMIYTVTQLQLHLEAALVRVISSLVILNQKSSSHLVPSPQTFYPRAPRLSSSKIRVQLFCSMFLNVGAGELMTFWIERMVSGVVTEICQFEFGTGNQNNPYGQPVTIDFIDEPGTTQIVTYQYRVENLTIVR
eukprot:Lithocolla_globosa_v1_NODE_2022_length_2204_cov_18.342950.p1 type:complete len:170 gc:universal NODE_2022_length_2204_cov_18.342950:2190-1681(-)